MDSIRPYWPGILDVVRQRVPQQAFDTWFMPLKAAQRINGILKVSCPNRFFRDWFSEHHLETLNEAVSTFFNQPVDCQLSVDENSGSTTEDLFLPDNQKSTELPAKSAVVTSPTDGSDLFSLNSDYTFENFVVGSGSDFAHATALAISKKLGDNFNPLFIYGGVGLGKTHLMHAIGNSVRKSFPDKRVCYVTAEQFMNDLIFSIKQNRTYDFKRTYRSVDVLLVDDVAFLAGKESTQEEFFHTFNTLYNDKKQIVLTSDRSPKEIVTLEERLRSRFEWGVITDIQPPDLETRIAILNKKVETNNIYIADDVIQYIAENITNNIRRLEGALIRLLAFASLTGRDITLEMASEILSSYFRVKNKEPILIADVIKVVADYFHVSIDQLKSKRRTQDLALARQVAMYIARTKIGASLNQIGRAFGNRDHTTVLYACKKIKKKTEEDPHFSGIIKDLLDKL
ncbi:MAG: chromosomal replication initiator protein DnaA [bacterium]